MTHEELEDKAKKELGTVNYMFACLDQPRGWMGYMGKALVNGMITAALTVFLMEIVSRYKRRHSGPRVVPMPNRKSE